MGAVLPEHYIEVLFNAPLHQSYTYRVPEELVAKLSGDVPDNSSYGIGYRVSVFLGRRKMIGYVIGPGVPDPDSHYSYKAIERVIDSEPVFGEYETALSAWMADLYHCSQGEVLSTIIPGGKRDVALPAIASTDEIPASALELTESQQAAVDAICTGKENLYYLFGVTGSGKTEVFLQAAERTIAEGRQVIYLVPEITLTHQLSEQVSRRFKDRVAILHSALTPSQRLAEWMKIRRGEVDIAIGARSAVFAPFANPGLFIIDEEHENSYKSGSTPRYHARQVAMHRTAGAGAILVMGSATPSLEAWHLMQQGKIRKLELPERISGGRMPEIEIVDISGNEGALSRKLQQEMKEVLQRKRQVILFLNRRGFSYFFHCRSCGYEMDCEHCSVSMTYHKSRNMMICHYCGRTRRPVRVCPECGSLDVGYSGFGTEMVEDEVKQLFPAAKVARLDTDAARKKDTVRKTLEAFRKGETDILLGTQMVAKGLNFPGVDLVGIILADSALHLPDFRAQERTFALIMQVSGRSGRFSDNGRVVVQTCRPENRAVRLAAEGNIDQFCREELEIRRLTKFPPFTRICRIVFRAKSESKVRAAADSAGELLGQIIAALHLEDSPAGTDPTEYLGPSECPIARISGNWRWQVIIRSQTLQDLHRTASVFTRSFQAPHGVYTEIDIDPVSLL